MELKRVVITGLGTINPIGGNVKEFFDSLMNSVSGAATITRFDHSFSKTKFACEVKNYNPLDFFNSKDVKKLDLYSQFAIIASDEAIKDSALLDSDVDFNRVGVIWGSGIGGIETFQQEMIGFCAGDGYPRFSPFFIPRMISDIAAGHISMKYGFKGPNYATVSACASSNHALIDAFNLIRLGKASSIVAGGSEASITLSGMGGFNSLQALSLDNHNPSKASRPYDVSRNGFVMGEGAGALVFEEYEHAVKRGAKIYAEVIGGGMSADAYHLTAPHPDGDGAARAMAEAIADANIKASDIDYVNTHGTSTPLGDLAELKAVKKVFGDTLSGLHISATKSMTGHLLGATGAVEAIICVYSILNSVIPATINVGELDPDIDPGLNIVINKNLKKEVNIALSNTFGFGGHNSTVILKKFK